MIDAGKRNRCVTILECSEVKNDEGVYVKTWIEKCKVWAYIKPLSGSEVYTSQATEHKVSMKINIRYNKSINELLRINIQGVLYNIVYIEDVDFSHSEMWLNLEKVI